MWGALVRKNLLLKRRSKCSLVCQILVPVLLFLIIFIAATLVGGPLAITLHGEGEGRVSPLGGNSLAAQVDDCRRLGGFGPRFCGVAAVNGSKLVDSVVHWVRSKNVPVQMYPTLDDMSFAISNASYFDPVFMLGIYERPSEGGLAVITTNGAFDGASFIIDTVLPVLSRVLNGSFPLDYVFTQTLPYPPFKQNVTLFTRFLFAVVPLFLFLSLSVFSSQLASERDVADSLQVSGVTPTRYLISWMMVESIVQLPMMLVCLLLISFSGASSMVPFWTWLVFYLPYTWAIMATGAVLSRTFPRYSGLAGFIYVLLGIGGVVLLFFTANQMPPSGSFVLVVILSCLSPIVPLSLAFMSLGLANDFMLHPHWTLGYTPPLMCLGLLVFSLLLHFLFYLYLCNATSHGWNFCCRRRRSAPREEVLLQAKESGVEIVNLTKRYGNNIAVDNLSLNIEPACITVLLGQNGAGKSTIISMLMGLVPPSEGEIFIDGTPITQVDSSAIGVCMQDDRLWEGLTVEEHLEFWHRMRGAPLEDIPATCDELDLEPQTMAGVLSGGQKRKLSLALALVGDPAFVLIDEASAGVDIQIQTQIWALLQNFQARSRSTVLLTTHEMQEAETLGTSIIIIQKGAMVRAHGGVPELIEEFGVGYSLVFNEAAQQQMAMPLVRSVYPDAEDSSRVTLDAENERVSAVCRVLDEARVSYRLEAGSLRDVFLQVADSPEPQV